MYLLLYTSRDILHVYKGYSRFMTFTQQLDIFLRRLLHFYDLRRNKQHFWDFKFKSFSCTLVQLLVIRTCIETMQIPYAVRVRSETHLKNLDIKVKSSKARSPREENESGQLSTILAGSHHDLNLHAPGSRYLLHDASWRDTCSRNTGWRVSCSRDTCSCNKGSRDSCSRDTCLAIPTLMIPAPARTHILHPRGLLRPRKGTIWLIMWSGPEETARRTALRFPRLIYNQLPYLVYYYLLYFRCLSTSIYHASITLHCLPWSPSLLVPYLPPVTLPCLPLSPSLLAPYLPPATLPYHYFLHFRCLIYLYLPKVTLHCLPLSHSLPIPYLPLFTTSYLTLFTIISFTSRSY